MPTYGRKKVKDMVKSVLPSTRRRWPKFAKQEMHQNSRRENKQELGKIELDPELAEDYLDDEKWVNVQTSMIVRERRGGDKVKPLMRWAPKVTKGKHDKRLAQLRAMMPKNTIGEHAIGHVTSSVDQFENPNDPSNLRYKSYTKRRKKEEDISDTLRRVLRKSPWLHQDLNDWMKGKHRLAEVQDGWTVRKDSSGKEYRYPKYKRIGPKTPRLLHGMTDIDDFVRDVKKAYMYYADRDGKYHPEWMEALKEFVAAHLND